MLSLSRRLIVVALALAATALPAQQSWDGWRSAIDDAFHRGQNHPLPSLEAKTWSTFRPAPGVVAERVTYNTADGMLVPAVLYRPEPQMLRRGQKLPAIVVVNGHGSDKFGWYAFYSGVMFARAGAVVLTYDPLGEGERNAQRASMLSPSPHERDVVTPAAWPKDEWGRRISSEMQADLEQGLRYVASRREVDSARIGVVGYSMGAYVAGIAGARLLDYHDASPEAASEPHFHALLLSGGGVFDDEEGYFDRNKSVCQGPAYRKLGSKDFLGDNRGFDIFFLNAQRGPTLVMNGLGDGVMGIPDRDPKWFDTMRARLLGRCGPGHGISDCGNVFTSVMYGKEVGHRPSWVNVDGVKWLNAQLHFAFWDTDAKIDAQGTTHVSAWITANHLAISPNYFREDREGGIDAVGTGVPAIARADLMVLPEADWQRLKGQLTYEAWAAKARAAEVVASRALEAKQAAAKNH